MNLAQRLTQIGSSNTIDSSRTQLEHLKTLKKQFKSCFKKLAKHAPGCFLCFQPDVCNEVIKQVYSFFEEEGLEIHENMVIWNKEEAITVIKDTTNCHIVYHNFNFKELLITIKEDHSFLVKIKEPTSKEQLKHLEDLIVLLNSCFEKLAKNAPGCFLSFNENVCEEVESQLYAYFALENLHVHENMVIWDTKRACKLTTKENVSYHNHNFKTAFITAKKDNSFFVNIE